MSPLVLCRPETAHHVIFILPLLSVSPSNWDRRTTLNPVNMFSLSLSPSRRDGAEWNYYNA